MAFPSVLQSSTFQKDDANATSFEVTRPAGLTNDNTLFIIFACDGNTTITMTADGLTELTKASDNTVSIRAGFRKIDGTEPTTFTITTSASERACAVIYEIQDAADPDVDAPTQVINSGTSATPDPFSHTPAGGAKDFLWLATVGVDRNRTIDSFPANMTVGSVQLNVNGGGANSCSIGSDTHQLNATSFNPDVFGISASDGWAALTINIFPATAVAPVGTGAPEFEAFTMTAIGEQPHEGVGTPDLEAMSLTAVGVAGGGGSRRATAGNLRACRGRGAAA